MTRRRLIGYTSVLILAAVFAFTYAGARPRPSVQAVPYGVGSWDPETLGNHRAVVRVASPSDAVWAHIEWRRRDRSPETRNLVVVDARTGTRVTNVARPQTNRIAGDVVFQPTSGAGDYHVYYLPNTGAGKANYPKVSYPPPEATAADEWLARHHLAAGAAGGPWQQLPRAEVVELQAVDEFNRFDPMEVVASDEEREALLAAHAGAAYLVFPEDRRFPIRMADDLPVRWIDRGPGRVVSGEAAKGEYYAFQLGVYAASAAIEDLDVTSSPLTMGAARIAPPAVPCINTGGTDWMGRSFRKAVRVEEGKVQALWCGVQVPETAAPGDYRGTITVSPRGLEPTTVDVRLRVAPKAIADAGDNEPWRHSRIRWLDSTLAADDEVIPPYTPVEVSGTTLSILGRRVALAESGLPMQIESLFAADMTRLTGTPRRVLAAPVTLSVDTREAEARRWVTSTLEFVKRAPAAVAWEVSRTAGPLTMDTHAELESDGNLEYQVAIRASRPVAVDDIRLDIPIARDVAKYMMGLGLKGGFRPVSHSWKWDATKNHDSAWIGDVNAGLQVGLKDDKYVRPLNTNFYLLKPLVMPASWDNGGQGGCRLAEQGGSTFLVRCYSGPRTIEPGQVLRYDFRLLLTPFRPIDTKAQFTTRFFHAFKPLEEVAPTGANTINVHHANAVNPYINYPFLRPAEMKAYIDEAHARGFKVKIYYTVRELSNRAPELFALRSLGEEVFSPGKGGGFSWLQEHLDGNYIAAWFVPSLKDAAIINNGISRWHNYYVEGLNWLVRHVGIDGLYIDDVAFDRTTMKRVRKVLERARPGALIDLHSANQYNVRDGFVNSANLYLEHFPYVNRLWFGEYFDYDSPPDFWLVEISGIPFGLMGEMLQDGGNPWRGMVFGMTSRLPWAGDPRPLWKAWDEFGMADSRMVGYWAPDSPVKTGHPQVLATAYLRDGKAMLALASWAKERVAVRLAIDWTALGLPGGAKLTAPAIEGFQPATSFQAGEPIAIEPGKGWLLVAAR